MRHAEDNGRFLQRPLRSNIKASLDPLAFLMGCSSLWDLTILIASGSSTTLV